MELYARVERDISSPCFDRDGRLVVVSASVGALFVEEAAGSRLLRETALAGEQPSAVAFDGRGHMFVTDLCASALVALQKDGTRQILVGEYEGRSFRGPSSLMFDAAESLFFTDSGPLGETTLMNPKGSVYCISGPPSGQILRPLVLESLAHPCGIAQGPTEDVIFVCETMANRVLRLVQRPAGVYTVSVFHQFAGRLGPVAIAHDASRPGTLYVARFEFRGVSPTGVVAVLDAEGRVVREHVIPGPEVTGVAVSPDGSFLYVTEASTGSVYRIRL
jgi:sugar lactone lactonase YvrE